MNSGRPIHAVIGVRRIGGSTFYVRRSNLMQNYPGVWSLFSIQHNPERLPDVRNLAAAQPLFDAMSAERLGAVPVTIRSYLTSGSSDINPMGVDVNLHLYEIEFDEEPLLNPCYYTEAAWLSAEEYEERCADQVCGLCLRLWADYAWIHGYTDRPFIPRTPYEAAA
ncbi:MAG TPA: hypothetical protein ENH55_10635 [Aurantimonas coralicida]|uniref:Uncharacterized protein n=2 Tax=root TaxID=1 RepID=A0A9C9TGY4_9HYPH|nr:hypothetical protein [Aurantimonas coralicida]HEU00945.1 hypothetical protein [Aurantimonas coralicida]